MEGTEQRKSVNYSKWFFYTNTGRKGLTPEEVAYWKSSFSKILKVGYEFEFNLPEKKNGTCKGNSDVCPCINLTFENSCWKKCAKEATCSILQKNTKNCTNVTGTCDDTQCGSCVHFAVECPGLYCVDFLSACTTCDEYEVPCSKCEFKFDPNKSPEAIRTAIAGELSPSKSYGHVGSYGVHSITTDGSLLGGDAGDSKRKGAEIITIGRRVDFWEFFKMTSRIIDSAASRGAYMNERCSTHMHVLCAYYGKTLSSQESYGLPSRMSELERDVPEIILANLHQLVRKYQNAMTWMTMALEEPSRMTRWEKFRVSVLPVSAVTNKMPDVQAKVSSNAGGNKYSWINYNLMNFAPNGDIRTFHTEFRVADGLMSPSAASAIGCMFYALVIKAIEISRYGVLEVGDDAWMSQAKEIKNAIMNNTKGWQDGDRFADTSSLMKYRDVLVEQSMDLVMQLKSILYKVGPAYEVLEKLAERPIALRRCEGESWEEIENALRVIVSPEDNIDIAVSEFITLNVIRYCKDVDDWIYQAASLLGGEMGLSEEGAREAVEKCVKRKIHEGELIWSSTIGSPLIIK